MRSSVRPGYQVDDFAGAYLGFAAGSALLWIGSDVLRKQAGAVPGWALPLAGAALAVAALAFAGADVLDAPAPLRWALRLTYAATLAAGGAIVFPTLHGLGSLLVAFAAGVAGRAASRRALSAALGLWCAATAAWSFLPHAFPPWVGAPFAGLPGGAVIFGAIGVLAAVAPARLRRPAVLALGAQIIILSGIHAAQGMYVAPFVGWPAAAGLAAGAFADGPVAWPRSLRAVLGRRIAFVAFAALWVCASAAALALGHQAQAQAVQLTRQAVKRAGFELDLVGRTMEGLAVISPTGDPLRIAEILEEGDVPILWAARISADGAIVDAWPASTFAAAPAALRSSVLATARKAVATHGLTTSPFFASPRQTLVATAEPLSYPRTGAVVAVYDVRAFLTTIATIDGTPPVTVSLTDGSLSAGTVAPKPGSAFSTLDIVTARAFPVPGSERPWRIAAAYSTATLLGATERRAAAILAALLVAAVAILWVSSKFAEAIARPIRDVRERAGRIADGEPFEPIAANNEELAELVSTLDRVSRTIRSRDHALTLAHDLTLGTFGLHETEVVRAMAERAVSSYFGISECARISEGAPAEAGEEAAVTRPAADGAATMIRCPLRAARSTLEVRLPHVISDDDLSSLSLLADTADLAIGSSALLRWLGQERSLVDSIYASVPVGIVLADQYGHIVLANDAAARLLEGSPGEIVGRRLAECLGTEGLHDGRIRVGAERRPVEVLVHPDADGARSLVVLRDLTEQEALEGLKAEFTAAVSHDLRTPLTAVKGFAVLLQERTDLDPEAREILMLIDRAANRLTRMIDDLMQTALLESGRVALVVEPIALGSAVRGLMLFEGESQSHQLVVEVPPQLAVLADRDRLEQVLVNLVGNAYKYAPRGRILVRARAVGEDRVEIAVSDDGPGIAPDEQERIFEKFYQAAGQGKRRRGVGLGLYISRELIERMGGTLTVRSVPGFGATFAVALRAAELGSRAERSA
ncbi:MAG TPA: HAMP domain-containing sensor histidine kinase [Candidatus Dormibacteraeota bacterium]|nr:HAMP domain-containing sensor histidine kinase [Candidatus Dormibacteraeota bacterium]